MTPAASLRKARAAAARALRDARKALADAKATKRVPRTLRTLQVRVDRCALAVVTLSIDTGAFSQMCSAMDLLERVGVPRDRDDELDTLMGRARSIPSAASALVILDRLEKAQAENAAAAARTSKAQSGRGANARPMRQGTTAAKVAASEAKHIADRGTKRKAPTVAAAELGVSRSTVYRARNRG